MCVLWKLREHKKLECWRRKREEREREREREPGSGVKGCEVEKESEMAWTRATTTKSNDATNVTRTSWGECVVDDVV